MAPLATQLALRQMLQDTLTRVGTLDVTDRDEMLSSLNLIDRLLVVIGDPAPRLHELADGLRAAGATLRPALAASLYRELVDFGRRYLGGALLLGEEPNTGS
jgi:hypothetical protein